MVILIYLLSIYSFLVMLEVLFSLLFHFAIVEPNQTLTDVHGFLRKITEPAYAQIRRVLSPVGGIDFSPLALLVLISLVQWLLVRIFL